MVRPYGVTIDGVHMNAFSKCPQVANPDTSAAPMYGEIKPWTSEAVARRHQRKRTIGVVNWTHHDYRIAVWKWKDYAHTWSTVARNRAGGIGARVNHVPCS